jgi:hypothetical protein
VNHIRKLAEKKTGAKTLADIFEFLKELQEIDRVWEGIEGRLQQDMVGTASPCETSVLEDVKALREQLTEMEKGVKEWTVTSPTTLQSPKKPEKGRLPAPREG